MTDPGHEPEQDAVRRLLAEARHDEPVPAEVRARLDSTLAELTAERREVRPTAEVLDLSARRRGRRRTGLLAAAAVVVAGVGLGQVLDNVGTVGGDDASSGAEHSTADRESADSDSGARSDAPRSSEADRRSLGAGSDPGSDAAVPTVRSTHLRADLRRARAAAGADTRAVPDAQGASPCTVTVVGMGDRVRITLDGDPVLAVYRPPSGPRQQVELYDCEAGEQVAALQLRVP